MPAIKFWANRSRDSETRHTGLEGTLAGDTIAFGAEADAAVCGSICEPKLALQHVVAAVAQTR